MGPQAEHVAAMTARLERTLFVSALAAASPAARATGSEMSGLALAWPMLLAGAVTALILLLWLLLRVLPRSWPKRRRWIAALAGAPLLLGLLTLLASGPGLLSQLLARLTLP